MLVPARTATAATASLKRAWACTTCCRSRYSTKPDKVTLAPRSSLIRTIGRPSPDGLEEDFALFPDFFSLEETRELLKGALWKLDRVDPVRKRRRRPSAASPASAPTASTTSGPLQDLFTGEYGFSEGHYDSVIHDYRESTISSLPPLTTFPTLPSILQKAFSLLPGSPHMVGESQDILPPSTISHLLHLAPSGKIDGHVDNLQASGSVIMGICLGSDRILRLDRAAQGVDSENGREGWEVLLRNGSVYLQKDKLRYEYEHSILGYDASEWDGKALESGHRLSVMIRDAPSRPSS